MSYAIQLSKISIGDFKAIILGKQLLPSRKCIIENIDINFQKIECYGITELQALKLTLNNPKKLSALVNNTGISADYLTIIKRELHALEQTPVLIKDFGLDAAVTEELAARGIRSSRDFYERAADISMPDNTRTQLLALCDLVRVNGIGAAAAMTFLAAGYRNAKDIATGEAGEMLERISHANSENQCFSANLGKKDMQYCIDNAKLILRFSD